MSLRKGLPILCFTLLVGLVSSCLDGGDDYDDLIVLSDAEILSIGLSHDSVAELQTVNFSIDQERGLIYNHDSMTYLTEINEKVIINYTSAAGVNNVLNITNGDSIWVNSGDSIDFSQPLKLKVYALDQKTTKIYDAFLNIHQVDPDSVQYQKIASGLPFLQTEDAKTILIGSRFFTYSKVDGDLQLHTSSDAISWQKETLSGLPETVVVRGIQHNNGQIFAYTEEGGLYACVDNNGNAWRPINAPYPVVSILGFLVPGDNQVGGLNVVMEKEGKKVFAFTSNSTDWTFSDAAIPDNFPLSDFASHSSIVMKIGRITNIGGISADGTVQNAVWSTQNGLYWAKISNERDLFPPLEGANAFYYGNQFWLINGRLSDGSLNREVYYSIDGGNTWSTKLEKYKAPEEEFDPRFGASLVVDEKGVYFYVIGGKKESVLSEEEKTEENLTEIWKVFQNKKTFN